MITDCILEEIACPKCNGSGGSVGTQEKDCWTCERCGGKGRIIKCKSQNHEN